MFCTQCGQSIMDTQLANCPNCGHPLKAPLPANEPAPSQIALPAMQGESGITPPAEPLTTQRDLAAAPAMSPMYPVPPIAPFPGSLPYASAPMYAPAAPLSWPPPVPAPQARGVSPLVFVLSLFLVALVSVVGTLGVVSLQKTPKTAGLTAQSTLAPTATAILTNSVIFQDPLTANNYGWANDSHCFFKAGGYHVTSDYTCFAPTANVADGTVSTAVKQIAGPDNYGYGLLLRHASTGNWYEFDIASNGAWIFYKVVNKTSTRLVDWQATAAVHTGLNATNTLKVQMAGAHFTFFINNIQVGQTTDTTFATGRVGVTNAGPSPMEAVFNNYLVTIPSN